MNKPEILKLYDNDLRQQVEYPEAGDMSKPIVQKHGFEYLTTVWDYILEQKEEE